MTTTAFNELLRIEEAGDDRFVATPLGNGFLFGGLSAALILRVGQLSVRPDLRPKSMHALFLRGGEWGGPHDIAVEHVTDSRAFSHRRITIRQHGKELVTAFVSFHTPEHGREWHEPMPAVPPPETLTGFPAHFGAGLDVAEIRTVHGVDRDTAGTLHPYWARYHDLVDDAAVRDCALTFLSDYMVIHSPFPRGGNEGRSTMSRTLEHAIWFHRPVQDDDWLLFSCDPMSVVGGRFVARGLVHDRGGDLLASFMQEGLLRPMPPTG